MTNYIQIQFSSLLLGLILLHCTSTCSSKVLDCQPIGNSFAHTITVGQSGHVDFPSVQTAIDSIPELNSQWIHIKILPGIYREKVTIPVKKPCIFLEGAGNKLTTIEWGDHAMTGNSATFTSYADNILAKGITFKNTYNVVMGVVKVAWRGEKVAVKQAVSARIKGDKSAFHQCAFVGLQDTLWDEIGRHYFKDCYIEGAIDFIFGKGQSVYKGCTISVNVGRYLRGVTGCITAQKKEWPQQKSGFVFKDCTIGGNGQAFLGRAWGPYSTVIFHNTFMSEVIAPKGWDAWDYVNHEANFTYVEESNRGRGANSRNRVPWVKKLSLFELNKYLDLSYINEDGWLAGMPRLSN